MVPFEVCILLYVTVWTKFRIKVQQTHLEHRAFCLVVATSGQTPVPPGGDLWCVHTGAELRNWLLFYSVLVLHGLLPGRYLSHWAQLVTAIYLYSTERITVEDHRLCTSLLHTFHKDFSDLYGEIWHAFQVMFYLLCCLDDMYVSNVLQWMSFCDTYHTVCRTVGSPVGILLHALREHEWGAEESLPRK